MGFSQEIINQALTSCERCCCICHRFCGTKIELHHIQQRADGGDDSFENCIPLCFDCHSDMGKADPRHPRGKHYSANELRQHRDNWYKKCASGFYVDRNYAISEADKTLFRSICSVFDTITSDGFVYSDFGYCTPNSIFMELDRLLHLSDNPFSEFINPELEKQRAVLMESIRQFIELMSTNTFSHRIGEKEYSVSHLWLLSQGEIPRRGDYDTFAKRMSGVYETEANQLRRAHDELWESYCEFVRQIRRIIGE